MKKFVCFLAVLCMILSLYGCSGNTVSADPENPADTMQEDAVRGKYEQNAAADEKARQPEAGYSLEDIPAYSGSAYVSINGGQPDFSDEDKQTREPFEYYSELDSLGRCGTAYANICPEIMPTEERGSIGQIKPSGWHTVKYNDLIDGNYLYNRCHLIGYQLTGENDNEKNLITGTRYLNVEGMLPFEEMTAEYVESTGNHVLYRVTPIFTGTNLVASGVEMEAWSVEDEGAGICLHVYCYNVQPGIVIDYADGDSWEAEEDNGQQETEVRDYVLNTNTKRIHLPTCPSVGDMAEHNREEYTGTIRELKEGGYIPCGSCLSAYRN